jgi:hypothetical protein
VLQSGVVHQNVEASEFVDRRIHQPANLGGISNVCGNEFAGRTKRFKFDAGAFA